MAFKNQGTTIISDGREMTVNSLAVSANARQTVGVTATSSGLYASVYQGTVSGYASGGLAPSLTNTIQKFPFSSDTNSSDVGDLSVARYSSAGLGSTADGYNVGGREPAISNVIDKFPFSVDTNATDVGDLAISRGYPTGHSTDSHGYAAGGQAPPNVYNNQISKFPFASDTNALDVGSLFKKVSYHAGQTSDVDGYTAGGDEGSASKIIITKFRFSDETITSLIGDLSVGRGDAVGQSSATNGYTSGGFTVPPTATGVLNTIDKFPFTTNANASDVGDLTQIRNSSSGQSSTVSGYTTGGYIPPSNPAIQTNVIDKFPFATDTNATDVGDLIAANRNSTGQQARTLS